jgi:nicotinamidase-related amidase
MNQKVPALDTLVPDSEWIEIDDRLDCREEDLIIEKTQASAFHSTELDDYLSAMGVDSVLVAGTTTSGCIRAGATDSCSNGYRTTIPEECVGDRSPEQGKANLLDLDARYADVRSLRDIITDLRGIKQTA